MAAENYPGTPRLGDVIVGADQDGVLHAGTALNADGELVSAGGRVLGVVGVGADLNQARTNAYDRIGQIKLTGSHYRTDIGKAAVDGAIGV